MMAAGLIALFALLTMWVKAGMPSPDLMAVYLAGHNFALGQYQGIYPNRAIFDLSVPADWPALARAQGLGAMTLYPFIYPPLWAALMAPLSQAMSPQSLSGLASLINPVLLGLSAVLTHRILAPRLRLPLWVLACLLLLLASPIGVIALYQNQPQILVSFLIILAIERARAGAPLTAGAVLALAASIKLYPLFFVVIWIARREWRALAGFATAGAALAGLSLFLAPYSLHLAFLSQLRAVTDTLILSNLVYTLDTTIGQLAMKGQFVASDNAAIFIAAKPLWLIWVGRGALLVALGVIWQQARQADAGRLYHAVWPAALILVSLLGPLAWAYHYLSVGFFLPLVLLGQRARRVAIVPLIGLSLPVLTDLSALDLPVIADQLVASLSLAALAAIFLWMPCDPDTRVHQT